MQEIIVKEGRLAKRKVHKAPKRDGDREIEECLAKLKVWQTENLMAPHGMDRFPVIDKLIHGKIIVKP